MSVASLTTRRSPPHDPLTLFLSRHDGWRALGEPWSRNLADPAAAEAITLRPAAIPEAVLLGPLGTLGGRLLPAHAALASGDALYLLDRKAGALLWFDRCACRFVAMPCPPRASGDARAIDQPVAVAASDQLMALAGRHGGKGKAVILDRFTLACVMSVTGDFTPSSIALLPRGLVVSDAASGDLLLFDCDGHKRLEIPGVGPALTLTRLSGGRLLAVTAQRAVIVELAAPYAVNALSVSQAITYAPNLPLGVDGAGHLVPGAFCIPQRPAITAFGDAGEPLATAPVAHAVVPLERVGRYVSVALDSGIHACQWHRVELELRVPQGCRATVRTRTAETDLPPELTAPAELPGWSAPQVFAPGSPGPHAFLVTSPRGRWLWLEIELSGDGIVAPAVTSVSIDFPRIVLTRFLPAGLTPDAVSEEFTGRFLASFDTGFREIETQIDKGYRLYDAGTAPGRLLDWLAGWVGLQFPRHLPVAEKRRLLRRLPQLFASRGTVAGLDAVLAALLRWPSPREPRRASCAPLCSVPSRLDSGPRFILEHWRLRRWLHLGRGRLGATSRLWGETILRRSRLGAGHALGTTRLALERDPLRDPFHAHAHRFSVFLPAAMARDAPARARIEAQIRNEAPAHTSPDVHWVEPNMRLGIQSMLGFDTVIGRKTRPACDVHRLGRMELPSAGSTLGVAIGPASALGITTHLASGHGRMS